MLCSIRCNVSFGSVAARQANNSPTAASGAKPAVREADFQNSNLNDCFTQQRPFRAEENHENDGQLTPRMSQSRFKKPTLVLTASISRPMPQSGAQRIAACICLPCVKIVLCKYHMRLSSVREQTMFAKRDGAHTESDSEPLRYCPA